MKTPSALSLAVFAVAATFATAHPTHRHLQNFPPANGQGQFRPGPMGPNAGGFQPQFGNFPMQGNGLGQFPTNAQMGTGNTQTLGVGEADVTGAGSATGANGAPSQPADPAAVASSPGTDAAATTTNVAPGEPTIMVILPDLLGVSSGWSSHSGDIGQTKAPSTEKPAEAVKPSETSVAPKNAATASTLALVTAVVTAFGLIAGGGISQE